MVFCNDWYQSMSNEIINAHFILIQIMRIGEECVYVDINGSWTRTWLWWEYTYPHANSGSTKSDGTQSTGADEIELEKYKRFGTWDEVYLHCI